MNDTFVRRMVELKAERLASRASMVRHLYAIDAVRAARAEDELRDELLETLLEAVQLGRDA